MDVACPTANAWSVYPHGCGVHGLAYAEHRGGVGLSPRVWGSLSPNEHICLPKRFIPTGVGFILAGDSQGFFTPVYPHGCGVHQIIMGSSSRHNGLSPRVWGSFLVSKWRNNEPRFIPTGVGFMVAAALIPASAHGTRFIPTGVGFMMNERAGALPWRFIPTGVGFMPAVSVSLWQHSVYPHGCGVHGYGWVEIMAGFGLSPRVWGSWFYLFLLFFLPRFIPTGVGFMVSSLPFNWAISVYPHGCGVH